MDNSGVDTPSDLDTSTDLVWNSPTTVVSALWKIGLQLRTDMVRVDFWIDPTYV